MGHDNMRHHMMSRYNLCEDALSALQKHTMTSTSLLFVNYIHILHCSASAILVI